MCRSVTQTGVKLLPPLKYIGQKQRKDYFLKPYFLKDTFQASLKTQGVAIDDQRGVTLHLWTYKSQEQEPGMKGNVTCPPSLNDPDNATEPRGHRNNIINNPRPVHNHSAC